MPDGKYGNHATPRRLATSEIPQIVQDYRQAAINAIEAGTLILIKLVFKVSKSVFVLVVSIYIANYTQ